MTLFANAKTIPAKKPADKKSAAELRIMEGIEQYAAIDAAMKSLKAMAEVQAAAIKAEMANIFVTEGCAIKKKPANFKGTEGTATASCEMKKRSTASVLTEDEIALLVAQKLPIIEVVKTEEAFLINPAYTHNMEILAKVEEALADVDLPEDFLMKQDKEAAMVVGDETVEALFKLNVEEAEALFSVVTTLAIKPSITGDFWGILDDLMGDPAEAEA